MKQFPNQMYRTLYEKGVNKYPMNFTEFSEETFRTRNEEFNGVYYSPQSYEGPSNKKEYLYQINTLFADLDVAKDEDNLEQEEIEKKKAILLKELQSLPTPPSAIVDTRNGLQPYWYVSIDNVRKETVERCESVIKSISSWAMAFGSLGDNVHDIVHILRVPGFNHHKKEPYLVSVLSEKDVTYTLEDLETVFPRIEKEERKEVSVIKSSSNSPIIDSVNNLDVRDVVVRAWEYLGHVASFDKDNHLIVDSKQTATFANREGKNFIATSSSDYPADGNAVTYVAETLGITTKEAFAWIVDNFDLRDSGTQHRSLVPLSEATDALKEVLESIPATTPKGDLPVLLEPLLNRIAREMSPASAENYVRLTIKNRFSLTGNDVTGLLKKLYELSAVKSSNDSKPNQAEVLVGLIENEDTEFFKNETNDAFVRIMVQDHFEIHPVKSKAFRLWAIGLYYKHKQGGAINSDAYQTARGIIEGKCIVEGKQYTIHPRVALDSDSLWYDLGDPTWRAVRINYEGWSVVSEPPILFRRYPHMRSQMEPKGSVHLREIFEFINVENEDMKLLLMVWVVTCFIKGFPHTAPIIHGQQGSAKTTASEILKAIIDPSIMKTSRLPHDTKETTQILAHSWLTIFDNVSPDKFSGSTSDLFCTVITGGGVSKRELYSDDEDVVYSLQRVIGINGIIIVANKPDLLDRSILIELARIPEERRKTAKEVEVQFAEKLPAILGGIFDTLVQAIQIKKTLPRINLPRMADFAEWGSAIAIALGYTQDQFLDSYKNNIKQQSDTVIDDSIVATLILNLLERQNGVEWEGSATELLEELAKNEEGEKEENIKRRENFPKANNALSRQLNELKTTLADAGCFVWQTGTNRKRWHVSRAPEPKQLQDLFTADETALDTTTNPDKDLMDESDECDVPRAITAEEDLISEYEETLNFQKNEEDEPF